MIRMISISVLTKDQLLQSLMALAVALAERARKDADIASRSADIAERRYQLAMAARRQLEANGSSQLVVEAMLSKMRSA